MSCATRYNGTSSVMAAVTGCPAAATAQTRPAASRTVQPNQPGPMDVPQDVMDLAHYYRDMGATMYIVGGACRDHLMGQPPADYDLLVVGLDEMVAPQPFEQVISNAPVYLVGEHEVALARREINQGQGKAGFEFVADASISVGDDLARRDFTVNAIAYNPLSREFVDPYNGQSDIKQKMLRPVSSAFVESPERVLRGAAFSSRLNFDPSPEFVVYAQAMKHDFETIPREQLWRFFEKGLVKGVKPGNFLRVLQVTGWVDHFPPIAAMIDCPQDEEYHPEGDVFAHTAHVMDELAGKGMTLLLAGLCHDMGKPATTTTKNGRIVSPGHAQHIEPTNQFLDAICAPKAIRAEVASLVVNHMAHIGVDVSERYVRRLSKRLQPSSIADLYALATADHFGRPPLPKRVPEKLQQILEIAQEQRVESEPIKPLVQGRHLIQLGMRPSREFGDILRSAEEAQIDGEFSTVEDGIEWLRDHLNK